MLIIYLEQSSDECRKSKTKVITLANQKGRRQSSKPIKTWSNYTKQTQSVGNMHAEPQLVLVSLLIGWKSGPRTLNQSLCEVDAKPKK